MKKTLVYSSLLPLALAWAGCSFQPKEGSGAGSNTGTGSGSGSGTGSTNGGGYDANLDRNFTTQEVNMAGGDACPPTTFNTTNLPPDLLILLDRSNSMKEDAAGMSCGGMGGDCGATSKWALMTAAINSVVSQSQAQVNWGLKFFGSSTSCTVANGASVAPAPNTAAAIASAITANPPGSSTPTTAAATSAGNYMATLTDANPKFILLATDGEPTCGSGGGAMSTDGPAAIAAVRAVAARGFPVFVIGIAADGVAGTTLDSMADAGGRPRAGSPKYYSVTSTADLAAALTAIQGMTALPCTFQLNGVPTNLNSVTVSVGGQVVPMSDWTYGTGNRSIVFPDSGTICMQLKNGTIKDVVIQLPCGETIIP